MKQTLIIIVIVLSLATTCFALRVETTSKKDSFNGYDNPFIIPGTSIRKSIGKLRDTDYGIILSVTYFDESLGDHGRKETKMSFYHLVDAQLVREEDNLFLVKDGFKQQVAERGFLRWKLLPGVAIRHDSISDFGTLTISVWLEIGQ